MKRDGAPYPLADVLKNEYPQIKETARVFNLFHTQVEKHNNYINENGFFCAENSLFDILTIKVLRGNKDNLIQNPNSVVLTESMAQKYYGEMAGVLGKEVTIKNAGAEIVLTVSGIIEDFPENSTFKPDFIASMELALQQMPKLITSTDKTKQEADYYETTWKYGFINTYILTSENFEQRSFAKELRAVEEKYISEPENINFHLQNLHDIYFHSDDISAQATVTGDLKNVGIFMAVGFLILLIACINYILLSTSQTLERSREIGIRKITGANRNSLFNQILVESALVTLIAFPLALILIEQLRPLLLTILEKDFIRNSVSPGVILGFVFILILVIYLPGMFTVRYFSRIKPVHAIKGEKIRGLKDGRLRKTLISVQFIVFLILVSVSIGIYKQIQYSKTHDLGFNPDNVITFEISGAPELKQSFDAFRNELLESQNIKSISAGMWLPPAENRMNMSVKRDGNSEKKIKVEALYVDKDFLKTLDIRLKEGKTISEFGNNFENKILINESAIKELGLEEPIGKKYWMGEIVGVIEDFHFHSFREQIQPMFLIGGRHMIRKGLVKFDGNNLSSVKQTIQSKAEKYAGTANISLTFLNQNFKTLYEKERKLALLIAIFAGIAILIASMGLLGLTIFTLKKRTKEIAIRKVNGATVTKILKLISAGYMKLIVLSFVISVPVAHYLLNKWLEGFAYKTNLPLWIYGIAVFMAFVITILTISFKTVKEANRNPVDSLRDE
jgi:putative ABC transport system permease protein